MEKISNFKDVIDVFDEFNPEASSSQRCSSSQLQNNRQVDINRSRNTLNLPETTKKIVATVEKTRLMGPWQHFMNNVHSEETQRNQMSLTQMEVHSANDKWSKKTWQDAFMDYGEHIKNYNIKWLKTHCKSLQVNEQVLFLAAMIVGVDHSPDESNITLSLMDPTGMMKAFVPIDVYSKYVKDSVQHTVVILRNFSLLPVSGLFMKHYIIVAPDNLEAVYSARSSNEQNFNTNSTKISIRSSEKIKIYADNHKKSCFKEGFTSEVENNISSSNNSMNSSNIKEENANFAIMKQQCNITDINTVKSKKTDDKLSSGYIFDNDFLDFDLNDDFDDDSGFLQAFLTKKPKIEFKSMLNPNTINKNSANSRISDTNTIKDDCISKNAIKENILSICASEKVPTPKKRVKLVPSKKPLDEYNVTALNNSSVVTCDSSISVPKDVQTTKVNELAAKDLFEGLDMSFLNEEF